MEGKKRNSTLWIILAIVVVILCCAAVAVALAIGVFSFAVGDRGLGSNIEERTEESFDVGGSPRLVVRNFAGNVIVRAGDGNAIQVTATKRVRSRADMDKIDVLMQPTDQGLEIRTSRRPMSLANTSVTLEIRAPAGTSVDIDTGAGQVEVRGLTGSERVRSGAGDIVLQDTTGEIDAHTGAGSIDVSGGTGSVRLNTGAGSINFRGTPQGEYDLQTGAGSIRIALPPNAGADLDLTTGIGTIRVDFPVEGQVTAREVRGVIGERGQASIKAHTGTGSIEVVKQ